VTYVIAEAGACGDGDLTKMLAQIDACADAGVDAVKFQWTSDATAMARRRGRAAADGYAAIYERCLQWPAEWHHHLHARCQELDRDYLCSIYLPGDVKTVSPFVRHFKVSSFEAQDLTLHDAVLDAINSGDDRWMLLSIGMVTEVESAILRGSYADVSSVKLLHCISAYPAPFDAICLSMIHALSLDGFSDHTAPELTMTGALAVAAGATIVEAHMRLDTTDKQNPDAPHAMTPVQLTDYVQGIRMVERAMFTRDPQCEDRMRDYRVGESDGTAPSHD
jgi:N,N'-diacetyllegionaminate synthase